MQRHKKGFLLFEFLVYFAVTIFFASIMGTWSLSVYQSIKTAEQQCQEYMQLCTAIDVFARDVMSIDVSQKFIQKNDQCLIWQQGDHTIGWEINDGKLLRYQGTYNQTNNIWSRRAKNLLTKNIDNGSLVCTYHKNNLQKISIKITGKHTRTIQRTVCCHNGVSLMI